MKKNMTEKEVWEKYGKHQKEEVLKIGPHASFQLKNSPRRVLFSLSRYKFAAKMMGENKNVLELGCSDGMGTYVLSEMAKKVVAVDFDQEVIDWAKKNVKSKKVSFNCDNFLEKVYGKFEGVIAYDVIEHIQRKNEKIFLETVCNNLTFEGVFLIGTPNITAKKYSSKVVNDAHVNLYSADRLKKLMEKYFNNVFMFGSNDEIVHTGFAPMSQYIIAIGCHKK